MAGPEGTASQRPRPHGELEPPQTEGAQGIPLGVSVLLLPPCCWGPKGSRGRDQEAKLQGGRHLRQAM